MSPGLLQLTAVRHQ